MPSHELPVPLGACIANKYTIERVLGRGGAGVVYAARNLDLDEPVALKFLRPDVAEVPQVVARFAREAKAAVSIKNEHVCRVLDVGTLPNGVPFMVMEYLEGRDLYRVMRERGPLPVHDAVEYVLQVCEALSFAHARGMVHRDIKPENIFLIEPPAGIPYVKVLDFGISQGALTGVPAESLVQTGALLGTPAYMSPEQIRATTGVDPRADLWALGVVLYELLTARPAFQAESVPQVAAAILEQEPVALREVRAEVPLELAAVVGRCLSKQRDRRPRDVAELAALLLPFAPKRARISVERASSVLSSARATSEPPLEEAGPRATAPGTELRARAPSSSPRPRGLAWLVPGVVLLGLGLFVGRSSLRVTTPAPASPSPATSPAPALAPSVATTSAPSVASTSAPSVATTSAPSVATPAPSPSASASTPPATAKLKPAGSAKTKPAPTGEVDLGF